jgi:hypothetical protein
MVKYPIYITSHKRPENEVAKELKRLNLDYTIVVNKDQVAEYKKHHKNVMVGNKGHAGAYNSILNKHKDGDFVWVIQDNAGDFKRPHTYKTALETLEKAVNKDIGMAGFRNMNFQWPWPTYTKNNMLLNVILHQVKDNIRADVKSLYFLEIDMLANYIINGLTNIRNNDIWLLSKKTATAKERQEIVDKKIMKMSIDAKKNMMKKFKLGEDMFRKRPNGTWNIAEGFFKKLPVKDK